MRIARICKGADDAKGTLTGWWEALGSKVLFDAAFGDTAVTLELVPSTLDASDALHRPADIVVSMSIEVAVDGG